MDDISKRALASREDEEKFNSFAKDSVGFIKSCAAKTCKRYINESDDEWSVALVAFYEAVRSFDKDRGAFSSFAALVISRRLKDYFDSEARHLNEISIKPDAFDGDIDAENADVLELEVAKTTVRDAVQPAHDNPVRDEIEALEELIKRYDIELFELGKCSPKAGKTKRGCAAAISAIMRDRSLVEDMRKKGSLPYTQLLKVDNVTKKILERHRKYIITAVEILNGDFPLLAEYVKGL